MIVCVRVHESVWVSEVIVCVMMHKSVKVSEN